MSDSEPALEPAAGPSDEEWASYHIDEVEELRADEELVALLAFEPVPRKVKRPDGWTAPRQREFILRLALCGTPSGAANQMGKNVSGIEAIYKQKGGETLRDAWDSALELYSRRADEAECGEAFEGRAPGLNVRPTGSGRPGAGRVLNEYDEWEDQESLARRAEEAQLSIRNKLLLARRLYLQEISGSAGKRAAFEILVELPIDWELAAQLRPQADEPWRIVNMRQPDMLLTAENGWMGDWLPGPDKMAELRRAIDEYRAAEGLGPVDWDADDEEEEEDETE